MAENLKIGYARVSTEQQNLNRQIDALMGYGVSEDNIYTEKMTGTKAHRPVLDEVRKILRAGDTLAIESLSRLGRSTKDLLNLLDEFENKGVQVVSLKENIDTKTPTGKLLITVLSAISQFERDLTVQRTNEGLKAARARGRKGGRPAVNNKALDKAIKLYEAQTHSIKEIVEITGVSQATLYRYLNKNKQSKN